MLLSWQSPRSAGIIKEQLITHNPLRARCLLCRSGRTVCVWAFVCRYLPPCFFSFLLFASPYMLVSSSCGEFCSPSVLLNRSLLLSSPLSDSLPTKSVHPSLHPSLPPPSLLPLTLSFRFILTWTRRESDLICCGLHSTESKAPVWATFRYCALIIYSVRLCVWVSLRFLWHWTQHNTVADFELCLTGCLVIKEAL